MRIQADYFERTLDHLPAYRERIRCYALRIGLEEVLDDIRLGNPSVVTWLIDRCRELLRERD
jgi:hygromycin-B 4-O-kinase